MPQRLYQWSALDPDGQIHHGSQQALFKISIAQRLRKNGLVPMVVQKSDWPLLTKLERKRLLEQLAMLLEANIPLLQALDFIIKEESSKNLRSVLQLVAQQILLKGEALSDALKNLAVVNEMQYQLLRAGELSGRLSVVLQQLISAFNHAQIRQRKIRKLLSYPATLLLVTIGVALIFLHCILPQFAQMFSAMRLELPLVTRLILTSATLTRHYALPVLLLLVGSGAVLSASYQQWAGVKVRVDQLLLQLPWLGRAIKERAAQKIFTLLHLLLSSGVHLVPAIALLKELFTHSSYRQGLTKAQQAIVNGLELHQALRETKLFDSSALQFVMLGEQSGQLVAITRQLGEYYNKRLTDRLENLGKRLEPIITLFLGVVVGVLVLGMYLPIFQLGEVVR